MASGVCYEAIRTTLATSFPGTPILRWEDVDPDSEQGDAPWFALEDSVATETALSIGSPNGRCLREAGTLSVHVLVPSTGNLEVARRQGDQIRDNLRFQRLATSNGLWVEVAQIDPPGQEFAGFGRWHAMTVNVTYAMYYPG